MSDHDCHSFADVGEAHRARSFFAPIDHDRAVQHRRTDFQFLAANAHERLSICRFRKHCSNLAAWSCRASTRQTLGAALVSIAESDNKAFGTNASTKLAMTWKNRTSAALPLHERRISHCGKN